MKKLLLIAVVALSLGSLVSAEESQTAAITKQAMLATKKALVAQNLAMTPDEEKKFWPAYDDYQVGLNKMNDEVDALIKKFAINFQSLTDDMAQDLVERYFKLEGDRINYRKEGAAKFSKMITPKKLARFVQIENKLEAASRAELAEKIPLVK